MSNFGSLPGKAGGLLNIVILDKEMMENKLLNFHPLVNTATTTIASKDLVKFLEHCNQEFEIIRL